MEDITITELTSEGAKPLGQLMVDVYSGLEGFPSPSEQPKYYHMLANVGELLSKPGTKLLAAHQYGKLLGGVVYYADMKYYGSGGTANAVKDASGVRLLAVHREARGLGIGKLLTQKCMDLARQNHHSQVILHTTKAMQVAWGLYEKLGFKRFSELDFKQGDLEVYGFRLPIEE